MRFLLLNIFVFFPAGVLAQALESREPSKIFKLVSWLSEAIQDIFINGYADSPLPFFVDVFVISLAVILLIRSYLELSAGKITVNDFIFSKLFLILLVFTVLDPVFYFQIFSVIQATSFDLGASINYLFTGFGSLKDMINHLFYIILNVETIMDNISWTSIAFMLLLTVLGVIYFWKNVIGVFITVCFFYFFSFFGFIIVSVVGFLIFPLVLIPELKHVVISYSKSVVFLFFFNVVWNLILAVCGFLIYTSIFGPGLLSAFKEGLSMAEFSQLRVNSLDNGTPIVWVIEDPFDIILPIILLAVGFKLVSMVFEITQFVLSGFFSDKDSFFGGS